jgi:hypothetical protein
MLLAGCVNISKQSPQVNEYLFTPHAPVAKEPQEDAFNIKVRKLNANAPFDDRTFIYRLGDNQFKQDYYNQFSISPATLLTQQMIDRLGRQPFIHYISRERDLVDYAYEVRGNITALYGDFRSKRQPKAYMMLHLSVFKTGSYPMTVVLDKEYSCTQDLADTQPTTVIRGWEKCLDEISVVFGQDLHKISRKTA